MSTWNQKDVLKLAKDMAVKMMQSTGLVSNKQLKTEGIEGFAITVACMAMTSFLERKIRSAPGRSVGETERVVMEAWAMAEQLLNNLEFPT